MKIGIMQPTYLPWLGYFELIANSERFVLLDDVQFTKKSWQQRNRIKTPTGELMLTVPVKTSGAQFQKINDVLINNNEDWKKKHLKSIEINYHKTPHFNSFFPKLEKIYQQEFKKLFDVNRVLIELISDELSIKTPLILSSEIPARTGRDEKIIDICKHFDATELYDAAGAEAILDPNRYDQEGIRLVFQNYNHPCYHQLYGEFLPCLSAIDLIFNEGERSRSVLLQGAAK